MIASQISSYGVRPGLGPRRLRTDVRTRKSNRADASTSTSSYSVGQPVRPPVSEDWVLVQQAIHGNCCAREQIFSSHATMLYRVALSILRNKEDAEDAVQDALCRAFARLVSFRGTSSFRTWLTRIVINSALMIRRGRDRHREASLDEILETQPERLRDGIVDAEPNPEEACGTAEIRALLDEQTRQLSPGLKEAFQAREISGRSISESSRALGIGTSAFKSRISRARRKIAVGLQQSLIPVGETTDQSRH